MTVKDHVRGLSVLLYYRKGFLYYRTEDTGLTFRVPIEDTGDATFQATEKSLLMMRYIRKELSNVNYEHSDDTQASGNS